VLIGWRYLAISGTKQKAEFLAWAKKIWRHPFKLEAATDVAAQQTESAAEMAVALS
jgi:hypothetical protein